MTPDALPLSSTRSIVVVGDLVEGWPPREPGPSAAGEFDARRNAWRARLAAEPFAASGDGIPAPVLGGYLERLPLAAVQAGLATHAEIWHFWRADAPTPPLRRDSDVLARRVFALDRDGAPFASHDALAFLHETGAPHILVVLGLGVDEAILEACGRSFKIYNSIDAPALRVPPEVSRHFDLVLTGAEWQSEAVRERHPGMATLVMPIGPELADPETFRPLGMRKEFDLVYVAAAQPYKRHDILFDAVEGSGCSALCVFGYGEDADRLRQDAAERRLDIEFVGPPGVSFDEVNRHMNRARIGVVCGVDDGAPAILTEYMLAGLPVLANRDLSCGLQFIRPETGRTATAETFGAAALEMLGELDAFRPRETVLERWTWPHSIHSLAAEIRAIGSDRAPLRSIATA